MSKPKMFDLTTLKANPKNPRTISPEKLEKLMEMIKEFPEGLALRPILYSDGIVRAGNKRFAACLALGMKEVPETWVKDISNLSADQVRKLTIVDNVAYGEWDWEILFDDYQIEELESWGLDIPGEQLSDEEMSDNFTLPSGAKSSLQQITFTLSDSQHKVIEKALTGIKKLPAFKKAKTDNDNANGNALYYLVKQWEKLKK